MAAYRFYRDPLRKVNFVCSKLVQNHPEETPRSNVTRMCEISESAGKIKANCIQRSATEQKHKI